MRRGDIFLADFGQSKRSFEFGKNRPALIIQTDKLNFAIEEDIYDYVIVIPLSTQNDILTEEFRYKISVRDKLQRDSHAVCNSICFLHKKYLKNKIAQIDEDELKQIGKIVKSVLELE